MSYVQWRYQFMDIINKLYPYPVLWKNNDDYINSSFDCDIDIEKNFDIITIKAKFKLRNKEINNLIEEQKAEYLLHIEAPATLYRLIKSSMQNEFSFDIEDGHLLGEISLCPFIVVREKITDYYNSKFNTDYEGVTFNLDIGNILAIGTQCKFSIEKDTEDLADVPSIFIVYKREDDDKIDMKVEINSDKIRIGLNRDVYENYNHAVALQSSMLDIVNTAIIFPTLVYVFEQLREGLEDYKDYRWFRAIEKLLNKESIYLNTETMDSIISIDLAQKIMHMPIAKTLLTIKNIDANIEDE